MDNVNKVRGYVSIGEIQSRHSGHFFDASAMRFFRSRLPQDGYRVDGKAWFITSEQFVDGNHHAWPRLFTLRVIDWQTGDINTVGKHNEMTRSQAQTAMKHAIADAVKMADFQRDEVTL